jgi:hypothetical protein
MPARDTWAPRSTWMPSMRMTTRGTGGRLRFMTMSCILRTSSGRPSARELSGIAAREVAGERDGAQGLRILPAELGPVRSGYGAQVPAGQCAADVNDRSGAGEIFQGAGGARPLSGLDRDSDFGSWRDERPSGIGRQGCVSLSRCAAGSDHGEDAGDDSRAGGRTGVASGYWSDAAGGGWSGADGASGRAVADAVSAADAENLAAKTAFAKTKSEMVARLGAFLQKDARWRGYYSNFSVDHYWDLPRPKGDVQMFRPV